MLQSIDSSAAFFTSPFFRLLNVFYSPDEMIKDQFIGFYVADFRFRDSLDSDLASSHLDWLWNVINYSASVVCLRTLSD